MRMLPTRYLLGKPAIVKQRRAQIAHVSIPAKGLSLQAKSNTTDAQFAGVLTNFYVDDDRITARSGFRKIATMTGGLPVDHLIPYYGTPERLAAATNKTFCDAETGTLWKSGFANNDWHWTSFSNLGDREYTVMCNGADGVWSWDGDTDGLGSSVTITKIEKTNPARCTVGAADISKFKERMTVIISGADAQHLACNGAHVIVKVNTVPNTFELEAID